MYVIHKYIHVNKYAPSNTSINCIYTNYINIYIYISYHYTSRISNIQWGVCRSVCACVCLTRKIPYLVLRCVQMALKALIMNHVWMCLKFASVQTHSFRLLDGLICLPCDTGGRSSDLEPGMSRIFLLNEPRKNPRIFTNHRVAGEIPQKKMLSRDLFRGPTFHSFYVFQNFPS